LLSEHSYGCLDEDLRDFNSFPPEAFDHLCHLAPALDLEMLLLSLGDLVQSPDHGIAIGETVGADLVGNAGGEDLLGAAASDLKQDFER
jgi:hypothetical protein